MDIFPRAEIAAGEVLTFEIASERGLVSQGDLNSAGAASASITAGALSSSLLVSAGIAVFTPAASALIAAELAAAGQATSTFPASSLVQGDLSSAGSNDTAFGGITFMSTLPLGDDYMNRTPEQRDMARPAEGRAMADAPDMPLARPAENRGMTK